MTAASTVASKAWILADATTATTAATPTSVPSRAAIRRCRHRCASTATAATTLCGISIRSSRTGRRSRPIRPYGSAATGRICITQPTSGTGYDCWRRIVMTARPSTTACID